MTKLTRSFDLSVLPEEERELILAARSSLESARGYAADEMFLEALGMLNQMDMALQAYDDASGDQELDHELLGDNASPEELQQFRQELRRKRICLDWKEALHDEDQTDPREASVLLDSAEDLIKDYDFETQAPEDQFHYGWLGDGVTKPIFMQKLQQLRVKRACLDWEQAHECLDEGGPEQALDLLNDLQEAADKYNDTARAAAIEHARMVNSMESGRPAREAKAVVFDYTRLGNDPETGQPVTEDTIQAFREQAQNAMDAVDAAKAAAKKKPKPPSLVN